MANPTTAGNDITKSFSHAIAVPPGDNVASNDERLAQLMDEYLVSLEQGTPIDLQQLIVEHEDLADEIRSMAASLELLHQTTAQMRPQADRSTEKPTDTVAKRLGDFEIGREIGRGGMGVVYAAKQISLQRQVALKVLPFAAMWDQKQIARFRNEALAAAQLHHPHIVPVFAVGEERGVHFYAMQLIEGQSLDKMVKELREANPQAMASTARLRTTELNAPASDLSTQHSQNRSEYCRAIARLGKQAALALLHAHEYGVVHRDVKPSNLMVDGQSKLWITDFGLARVQNGPGVTITGDVVGTLRYMSPEQAAGQPALVDSRTDIYGLGATLYELLTLQAAFPGEDRHAVLRDIATKEPTPPRAINPAIPADLETIVLQAMSKSRDSRYATAQALADDLDRFLQGKPTLARRPTVLDRTAKWMRRHRSLVALAAVFLLTITLGSVVAMIRISQEQQQTEAALAQSEQNLQRANENFAQARRVVDRFGIQLADQLQDTPGTEQLRQDLLLETLQYYRDFASQIDGQLDVQDQLAMTHLKSGAVTAKLGAHRKAMSEYQAAQQILQQLLDEEPENAHLKSQLALSRNNMALLFAAAGEIDSAEGEYKQAIASQRELVESQPDNLHFASQLAESHLNLGTLLGQTDRLTEALESLNQAIEILHNAHQAAPKNLGYGRSLAMAYNNLGYLQRKTDANSAMKSASQAVALLERVCQTSKATQDHLSDLSLCYGNLAAIQNAADKTDEAIQSYQRAIALRESLVRRAPAVVRHRSELAANLNNLALLHIRTDHVAAATEAFTRANQLFAELLNDYPNQIAYASGWAALLNNQGLALAKLERFDQAAQAYQQAVAVQDRVWQQLPNSQSVRDSLSRIHYNYGQTLLKSGRVAEAVEQALARRVLWADDAEKLFGVAVELAQLMQEKQADGALADEVVSTLVSALQGGYEPEIELNRDERFRRLHDHTEFQKLLDSTKQPLAKSNTHQQPSP